MVWMDERDRHAFGMKGFPFPFTVRLSNREREETLPFRTGESNV
jgi:hypothetical protein